MRQFIALSLVAILVGGLIGLAIYEYQNRPTPAPVVTYSAKQYQAAVLTTQTHDAVSKVKADQLAAQIQAGDTKLANVCTQLKNLKQTNANCTN